MLQPGILGHEMPVRYPSGVEGRDKAKGRAHLRPDIFTESHIDDRM